MSEERKSIEVRLRWRDCFKIATAQFLFNLLIAFLILAAIGAATRSLWH
jgi:hypothetical protein